MNFQSPVWKRFHIITCLLLLLPFFCVAKGLWAAPESGRIHVIYWEKWTGFEKVVIQSLVDDFNRSQDRITVDLVGTSAIDQKTLVATAGGVPPDLAGLWEHTIVPYADKGALMPLDEFLPGSGAGTEYYVPAIGDLLRYQGKTWALVAAPNVVALHYNRKLFREAGLDPDRPPRTISELDAYAKKLTKVDPATGKITQLGFLPVDPGWWNYGWGYYFGGQLWNGKDRITADSPENVASLEWIKSYVDRYGAGPLQVFRSNFGVNYSMSQNSFMNGTLAMQQQGSFLGNYIHEFAPDLDWGAAPMPVLHEGEPSTTLVNCDVLCIPKGAKHPREAFEFMVWLNRQENMERLCLGQQKISPLRQVSEKFYSEHKNPYIRVLQQMAWSPRSVGVPQMGIFREYHKEMDAAVDAVWNLAKTPQQALGQVQERLQRSLDRELEIQRHPPAKALAWLPMALSLLLVTVLAGGVWMKEREERRNRGAGRTRGKLWRGLLFASPGLIGLLVFTLYPLASALIYSFCEYSVLTVPRWTGLANLKELATDQLFWLSLKNTAYYAAMAIPLGLLVALASALLLDSGVRGGGSYRAFFFLPVVAPLVANCTVWMWILNTRYGVLNHILEKASFGLIHDIPWLTDARFAMPSLVLMSFWGVGQATVILMTGLQEVPVSLYEAAELDGAGWWSKTWHVSVPAISPVLYFNLIIGVIGSLQVFAQPFIMTNGGPSRSTFFYTMYLWDNATVYMRMGYASAMAWILFLIILGLSWLLTRLSRSNIHYAGE